MVSPPFFVWNRIGYEKKYENRSPFCKECDFDNFGKIMYLAESVV